MERSSPVAVLFARRDSIYRAIPGCDVFDAERDARTFKGGMPVVAHPPCAQWGALRGLSISRQSEKELAVLAVGAVRAHGGVLEHPAFSTLWDELGLPRPGEVDCYGGYTLDVFQGAYGHRALKRTWVYVVGARRGDLPRVKAGGRRNARTVESMGKREREATPLPFAKFLVRCARATRWK